MARSPDTPDCSIKGCSRAVRKGFLCAEHYGMVPSNIKRDAMWRSIEAQVKQATKCHRDQLAYVRKVLA